jgi:2-amino-4-hydroxy-6-hydroxymethyldihydropteridine diphosphokinase
MKNPVTAYIGLGSNLANPAEQIKAARAAIADIAGVQELAFSSVYHSPPMGPQDQPDYVNAVMAIATELPPIDLLRCLQQIENEQGRVRKAERWGARTLDLDVLIYGEQEINLPDLIVPHTGLAERAFVLYPLFEIAPQLIVPGKGAIATLLADCPRNGLERLN